MVSQTDKFTISDWQATLTATSNNGTSVSKTIDIDASIDPVDCKAEWKTKGVADTDTINTVTWARSMSGWSGAICGAPSFEYA